MRKAPGFLWMEVEYQDGHPVDIATYKSQWKSLLQLGSFWAGLRPDSTPYTRGWGQEVYTWCKLVCVPGRSLGAKATAANAYMQHPARLAFARDSLASGSSRHFFDVAYLPFENAWWVSPKRPQSDGSYQTLNLNGDIMQRFVSLQVFATRTWALATDASGNRMKYPDRRIGFAWNEHTDRSGQGALARRLAQALRGAYSLNGTPKYACSLSGSSTRMCNPSLQGAAFTSLWSTFAFWG
jgi:hypothetical protein